MPSGEPRGPRAPTRPGLRPAGPGSPSAAGRAGGTVGDGEPVEHRLYARIAWSTLDGLPLVAPRHTLSVEARIITLCRRLDVEPMEVRARPDRVDVLIRLKPVHTPGEVAARVKAGAGEHLVAGGTAVRWARGVAMATVEPDAVRDLMRRMALLT